MDYRYSGNSKMYKATKIWNECIYLFKNGMPVKRHRYHVRIFPDTFTGEEAANWLYGTLKMNSYFGQDVSKAQVIQLLNKFFKSGVFEGIKPMKNFKAGKQLYRFKMGLSSGHDARDPLAVLSNRFENEIDVTESIHNDKNDFKEHKKLFKEKQGINGAKNTPLTDEGILSSEFEENVVSSNKLHKPCVKSESSSPESDSLQKLKNQLKIEMKKEYWKREDLKRDFLRRLISEKIQENQNMEEKKILADDKPFNISELNYELSDTSRSDSVSFGKTLDVSPKDDSQRSMKKFKNEYLGKYLMKAVLKRINNILGPYVNLNSIIPFDNIDPVWIICNIDSSIECMDNVDLPPWIIDAAACLGFFGEVGEDEKYPGYYEDVYNVLCENIVISCTGPLIPVEMNKLILNTFQFLEKLNQTENNSNCMTASTEDLISDMLTPTRSSHKDNGFDNMGFTMHSKNENDMESYKGKHIGCSAVDPCLTDNSIGGRVLPENCCYETAFTSDVPVTRIIRHQKTHIKRAQSVLSLKDKTSNESNLPVNRALRHTSLSSLKHYKNKEGNLNSCSLETRKATGDLDFHKESGTFVHKRTSNDSKNSNILLRRSNSISVCKRSLSCDNLRKIATKPFIKRSLVNNFVEENKYNCYINYGMSNFDDTPGNKISGISLNEENSDPYCINYADAIKDINRLVQYSRSNKNSFLPSDARQKIDPNNVNIDYTPEFNFLEKRSSYSDSTSVDSDLRESIVSTDINKRKINWLPYVEYLGLTLFRNEFLLLHPKKRNKLNIILFLIHRIPFIYKRKQLEKINEMLKMLSCCVLCSSEVNDIYEDRMIAQAIQFFVEHRQEIMKYVDDIDDHLLNIRQTNQTAGHSGIKASEINLNEYRSNYVTASSNLCTETSTHQKLWFPGAEPQNTIFKLIHRILNDENCSNKEKKMLLKMLSDVYPDVDSELMGGTFSDKPGYSHQRTLSHTSQTDKQRVALQKLKNLRL